MPALRGPGFGAETEPTPAADAAAWSLVALLIISLAIVFATLIMVRKQQIRKKSPLNLENDPKKSKATGNDRQHPWQKPEDWWKH